MNNKYYDGSEKDPNKKKPSKTGKSRGKKAVNFLVSLATIAMTIIGVKKGIDTYNNGNKS